MPQFYLQTPQNFKYGKGKKWVLVDCPLSLAKKYCSATYPKKLLDLRAVIYAPTFRLSGTLLDAPGYDAETGLFYHPGKLILPNIPANPTSADALASLKVLRSLLSGFPFVSLVDETVVIAAILTAIMRPILTCGNHCMHLRLPQQGPGKRSLPIFLV